MLHAKTGQRECHAHTTGELASEFVDRSPWIFGVLWGSLMVPGMVGSGLIGRQEDRAGRRHSQRWHKSVPILAGNGGGDVPHSGSCWNAEDGDKIPAVIIWNSIPCLRPVRHYAPPSAGDNRSRVRCSVLHSPHPPRRYRHASIGGLMLCVVGLGAWRIRKSGVS